MPRLDSQSNAPTLFIYDLIRKSDMTFLSKQTARTEGRKVDLTRHTDEDLHNLMDSVTSEMARRASVNAKRRALVRRLEVLAESEGVTLDEVRQYLRGEERVSEPRVIAPELEEEAVPTFAKTDGVDAISSMARDAALDRQFESMLQKELG